MPQYVVRLVHTPEVCPTANAKSRERIMKSSPEMPKIAQKLGVRFIAGPLVLASEHTSIAVAEAASAEIVQELILQSGLMQWNTVYVSPAKSMEEAMKDLEKAPPPIF